MNQEYWDQFARTGRVEDYLSYREKEVCKAKTEKYGDKCSESVNNNDRDDSVGSTITVAHTHAT